MQGNWGFFVCFFQAQLKSCFETVKKLLVFDSTQLNRLDDLFSKEELNFREILKEFVVFHQKFEVHKEVLKMMSLAFEFLTIALMDRMVAVSLSNSVDTMSKDDDDKNETDDEDI